MTGVWLLVLIAVQFEPSQGLYAPPVELVSQHPTKALCESELEGYIAFSEFFAMRGKPGVGQSAQCVFVPVVGEDA